MTPISKVPKDLLEQPPTQYKELEKLRKELESLHRDRRPFIGIGLDKIYLDEGEEYYQNLNECQVELWKSLGWEYPPTPISRWPWKGGWVDE